MSRRASAPGVLVALYDLVVWYTQRTARFPKSLLITLGDRHGGLGITEFAVHIRGPSQASKHWLQKLGRNLGQIWDTGAEWEESGSL